MNNKNVDHRTEPGPSTLRDRLLKKMNGVPDFLGEERYFPDSENEADGSEDVLLVASAQLPTRFGTFTMFGFYDKKYGKEHTALVRGDVRGKELCPVRVHSECHTGDIWGSLRCDCREQLEAGIRYVSERPFGVVVYLRQEGRGIGLLNKIKAYQLQDLGLDTIEANQFLGYPPDAREYGIAARILGLLGVKSVSLLTNNPDKIEKLESAGVKIAERIPLVMEPNVWNSFYMETKRDRMGHIL